MSSESKYITVRKILIKEYLQEALSLCISCVDATINMPCTANCSQQYIYFSYGKSLLEQKLSHCKSQCQSKKNDLENKDCLNTCYESSYNDIVSLDKLLKL